MVFERAEGTHIESLGFPTLGEGSHRFHACCRHAGWGPGFQPSDTGIWTMGSGVDSPTVDEGSDKGTAKVVPKCPNSRQPGLKPCFHPLACLQHARNEWGILTWGWKPQAIDLRAYSTPTQPNPRLGISKLEGLLKARMSSA